MYANTVMAAASFIIMFTAGLWAGVAFDRRAPGPTADAPTLAPTTTPVPVAAPNVLPPAPAVAAQPPAKAKPPARPAAPAPAPAPKEPANAAPTTGWDLVERDPSAAAQIFQAALRVNPGNLDAAYGYGYAQLKVGDRTSAASYLCRARGAGGATTREIDALLLRNQLTCSGP
jgi:hypothetical protein